MAKKKKQTEGEVSLPNRKCLSCGQEFKPKGRTNRICPRKQCRVKRSRPGMYTILASPPISESGPIASPIRADILALEQETEGMLAEIIGGSTLLL